MTRPCPWCGDAETLHILEIWDSHEFMLEACCFARHEQVVADMADDPTWARAVLRRAGVEELTGQRLRRVADDGGYAMLLDYQLELCPVTFEAARAFVARHHRHCAPPVTWRFGQSVRNGRTALGVVVVGNPVAPALNGRGLLEVNRLCIRRDVPRALAWNAASMLYGWAAREAERRGWSKVVTYTRADEDGTSLIAAGWVKEAVTRGRGWHSEQRRRSNTNAFIDKVRWAKALKPRTVKPRQSAPEPPRRPSDDLHRALFGDGGADWRE